MDNCWPFDGHIKPVEKYERVIYNRDRNAVHGNKSTNQGAEWLESHHAERTSIRKAYVQTLAKED